MKHGAKRPRARKKNGARAKIALRSQLRKIGGTFGKAVSPDEFLMVVGVMGKCVALGHVTRFARPDDVDGAIKLAEALYETEPELWQSYATIVLADAMRKRQTKRRRRP